MYWLAEMSAGKILSCSKFQGEQVQSRLCFLLEYLVKNPELSKAAVCAAQVKTMMAAVC